MVSFQLILLIIVTLPKRLLEITYRYYYGIYYYTLGNGRTLPYNNKTTTVKQDNENDESSLLLLYEQQERIHLYSIACNIYLYHYIHYRKSSYKLDLYDNLQNVAIPGTGIKLSYFINQYTIIPFLFFLFIIYPIVSFISSIRYYYTMKYIRNTTPSTTTTTTTTDTTTTTTTTTTNKNNKKKKNNNSVKLQQNATASTTTNKTKNDDDDKEMINDMIEMICEEYTIQLLRPNDWFSYWRLNSIIVGMHSYLYRKQTNIQNDYSMENKWTFLQYANNHNVPVSPYLNYSEYVIKHKNEEGGLGIYFYKNAVYGGDWIIQERIYNNDFVNTLLPNDNPPLSTFRIITCSKSCYMNNNNESSTTSTNNNNNDMIIPLSCVFRAGRANALTDHSSILFDVDMNTGIIKGGTTNSNWYQLGLYNGIFKCPWRSYDEDRITNHPDDNLKVLSGITIPNFQNMLELCLNSHKVMCPTVPFAGWDVVYTNNTKLPLCLLEVNLSCNFFRGTFHEKVNKLFVFVRLFLFVYF